MTTLSPFLSINSPCAEALQLTMKKLSLAGLRAMQTFDLHTARLTMHNCPCPNHGTDECDCQMVVMLVYGESTEPATLILHGNGGQTSFSLVEQPANIKVILSIQQALEVNLQVEA